MPNVQAPDGTVVNFPDTMAQDDIAAAMRQNFPPGASGHADPSFWADLKSGVHDAGTAFAQGAKAIGGVMSRNGMTTAGPAVTAAGDWLQNHTPDEAPGNAPGQQLSGAIKNGDWSSVPGYALHSAVRALPSVAPILAGGAIAGPVGAGVAAGAEALGPSAYARAQNNGRTEPTTADVAESLPNVAAQGVLGSVLPGGAAAKIANPLVRGLAKAGIEAAAGGGMDAAGQLGTTLGTDKGASIDPYQTAGAALTQGAIGVARGVPEVARAGVKAGADQLMARTLEPPADTDSAASVIRVNNAMDQARQTAVNTTGKPLPDNVLANNVKVDYVQSLNNMAMALFADNQISRMDLNGLRSAINNQALRHNNTISEDTLGQIDDLGIGDQAKGALKDGLRDLNTVSTQSFIKNGTGPFRILGTGLGHAASVVGGVMSGNPLEMAAGVLGQGLAGKMGGALGGVADRAMGTNTPPVVLQAINARRALKAAGVSAPTGAGIDPLNAARAGVEAGVNPVTGNAPDPVPVNTPIPSPRVAPPGVSAPVAPPLPALRPDTPASVASTLAADNMASGAPQMPAQDPVAPGAPNAATNFILGPRPDLTPSHALAAAQQVLGPDGAARLMASTSPIDKALGRQIQAALPPVAQAAVNRTNMGHAVEFSEQARVNAREYQNNARAYASMHPDVGDAVLMIAQAYKTPGQKQAAAAEYIQAHPEAAGKFPDWLLNHGGKDT